MKRRPLYLFSGSLVAAALAAQAGYAWGSPYINPEIKVRLKGLFSPYINPEIKVRLKGLLAYIQATLPCKHGIGDALKSYYELDIHVIF